ncbi:MAG TPA: M48 family metallopeptidase [Gaiellaceae bacterium]|nr:M48 family metallopeptidase [Gaiellaceae bacterium]
MRWKNLLTDLGEAEERRRLRRCIQRLLDKWQPKLGVHLEDWDLRKMKMYWGSSRKAGCDTIACRPGHITFNTELAKLPRRYIEYIVVHELVHHLTDGHDAKFYELMDKNVPGWRAMQARIEEPLRRYS